VPRPPGLGEALIDVVTTPEGTNEHPGGSPANVAYGLARLGVSTGLLASIGIDGRGDALEEHLTGAGVTLLPGSRSLERTSTATATLARDGSASYAFDITWDVEPLEPALTPPRIVHTGSIASFLSPGAGGVKAMLQELRSECVITYDPNIRPALLGLHAEAQHTFEELMQLTSVVKLSDEDAAWLYPKKALKETATHILDLGAELAVITRGSSGSLLAAGARPPSEDELRTQLQHQHQSQLHSHA
jgi:fructokinase